MVVSGIGRLVWPFISRDGSQAEMPIMVYDGWVVLVDKGVVRTGSYAIPPANSELA